jgi:hypothetical protein
MRSLGWAFIKYDGCPYKKKKNCAKTLEKDNSFHGRQILPSQSLKVTIDYNEHSIHRAH